MSATEHRPLVKICGVSRPEHAEVAAEAGADFIGVVFYPPSIRNVSIDAACAVAAAAHAASNGSMRVVGLFVNAPVEHMNAIADAVGLDLIQLSGDEPTEILKSLNRPAIKSIRIDSAGRGDEERLFHAWTTAAPRLYAVLLDSHSPGMYGGTGTVADWFVAADFAHRFPTVLAGGLTPENVARAIQLVQPAAVDVSSGVETEKQKDPDKIRAFIHAAKAVQPGVPLAAGRHGGF